MSSGTHASFNTLITGIPRDDGTSRFSGNFTTEQHERVSPSSAAIQSANASSQPAGARSRSVPHSRTVSAAQCPYCGNDTHKLLKCEQFHVLSVSDRNAFVKENRICMLCLNVGHFVRDCLSRYRCFICQRRHSRSLCGHGNGGDTVGDNNHDSLQTIHQNEQVALSVSTSGVFMPLVRVLVNGVLCVALLDSGSSQTFLTQDMADRLGLVCVDVSFNLSRLNSITQMHTKTATVQVQAANMAGNVYACNVCFTDYIPTHVPPSLPGVYPHLEGLSFCQRAERIDLLIGQDHAELLMPHEVRSGSDGAPYAVRTTLGWTLHGSIAGQSPQSAMCMFTFSDMPDKVSQDDLHVIKHWDANTKTVDDHYEIPVPWIDSTFIPPETRYMAKVRHDALCVRLNAKPEIKVMYNKAMDTMLNNGYAEEVPPAEPPSGRTWYLPHHHVYNPAKPDKVRVVFDCAARSRGISLNDRVYQGPKLTTLLNVVLLICIMHSCVISGDVQAIYNQVKLPVGDVDMMRFLWNCRAYRKTSQLFGDSWCATRAVYALRRVTQYDPVHRSDDVISEIRNGLYVDDLLLNYSCPDRALSLWERMIRTIRKVLLGVCVDQRFSDESFETLLTEIEAIINGRPLTKLSDDPNDPAPLTPNHLLIGCSGPSLAPGKFDDADALRRRWKLVQRLADKFWTSWSKQYITELQSRVKWQTDKANLKIGDLVLVVDELKHRNQWPLGRVGYVSYSRDGLVRLVRVMTATTEYVRPITKVVLLEAM